MNRRNAGLIATALASHYGAYQYGNTLKKAGKRYIGYKTGSVSKRRYNPRRAKLLRSIEFAKGEPDIKKLNKQVKKIRKLQEANMGRLTYRLINALDVDTSVGQVIYSSRVLNDKATIESVLGQLRFFDPTAPSTLVTADFTSGTYQKEILFEKTSKSVVLRNNYKVPINVVCYTVCVKEDTDQTPVSAMSSGVPDVSNVIYTSPWIIPSDVPLFRDLWRVDNTEKVTLEAGAEKKFKLYDNKGFTYDPSYTDIHTLQYQTKNNCKALFFRLMGTVGHDTVADQQGIINASVDMLDIETYHVKYDAGADIEFVYINDTSASTFTNSAVVCNKVEKVVQAHGAT